jgi:sulfur-oxidizing protein SoxY
MKQDRRAFLKLVSLMTAAGMLPGPARAETWNQAAFAAKSVDDVVKLLGGSAPQKSDQVVLNGPEIAENGAVVPLEISSKLRPPSRSPS